MGGRGFWMKTLLYIEGLGSFLFKYIETSYLGSFYKGCIFLIPSIPFVPFFYIIFN